MINNDTYVIGIDYGTLSARAMVARTSDGLVLSSCAQPYAHGVLTTALPDGTPLPQDFALAVPADYLAVLKVTVQAAIHEAGIPMECIVGIGVDATSCTVVPTDDTGTALAELPEFSGEPHAYIKMWKHHAAQPQADRLERLAVAEDAAFLKRCGNHISCEWMIPKIMEVREHAPQVYAKAHRFSDLCDWLTWRLTGELVRSTGAAGFKCHWSDDMGYPPPEFYNRLLPGFGGELMQKLAGRVRQIGSRAGYLSDEAAQWLGLPAGIAVAVGSLDGHSSVAALGILEPGDAALVVGTSNVMTFLSEELQEIDGICGVAYGGLTPGHFGYDTGQNCTGDMLDWFVKNCVPAYYTATARQRGITVHELLCEKAIHRKPEKNHLTVLDWWNGNRNIIGDMSLTGLIWGFTLHTAPEDIYCAMLQAIACGTKKIVDHCGDYGIPFRSIAACGGIPNKNPLLMQQYANILGMPVRVAAFQNTPALGACIYAAAAAGAACGGYDTLEDAVRAMKVREFHTYEPQTEYHDNYQRIYHRFCLLHDAAKGLHEETSE